VPHTCMEFSGLVGQEHETTAIYRYWPSPWGSSSLSSTITASSCLLESMVYYCHPGLPGWFDLGTWWLWYAKVSGGIRTSIVVDAVILHFPERA
jgi:hypothetical protein